jgi:hypothetical protein
VAKGVVRFVHRIAFSAGLRALRPRRFLKRGGRDAQSVHIHLIFARCLRNLRAGLTDTIHVDLIASGVLNELGGCRCHVIDLIAVCLNDRLASLNEVARDIDPPNPNA